MVKNHALDDLKMLAKGAPHMWKASHTEVLIWFQPSKNKIVSSLEFDARATSNNIEYLLHVCRLLFLDLFSCVLDCIEHNNIILE